MGDLSESVLFTTGGLTRLLDRMEQDDLVRRERTQDDRRGVYAVLTEAGHARLRQASDTHLRGIQAHFAVELHDDEIETVSPFLARLVARLNQGSMHPNSTATDSALSTS
jgi:DNA-binding MarR family transcriptional regulator